ncbi:hypothetical protein PLESTF_000164900 [Pleodorina starrii]|nr:hypothetical protein PLESTF_000164900 [Pleodorina starrii]
MGAAALHQTLPARRTLSPYVARQLASSAGGVTPQARHLWSAPHPTAMVPSALARVAFRDSPPAGAAATPCVPQQLPQSLAPWRLRHPRSSWLLPPQPGCMPSPRRTFQSRAGRTPQPPQAASPGPDPTTHPHRPDAGGWVSFFATCHPGLEQVPAPFPSCTTPRGRRVSDGYAANLWLRSAIRVLVLLAEGELGADPRVGVRGGQALYDMVYDAAPWHEVIPEGRTFSVEPRLWSCTDISSTRLVWSRVKDAVCDSIRRYRRDKPAPPERGEVADVPLYVSCYRDRVRLFRDMSGNSLHRRGYRDVMHRAALNEAAAAGVLALSGWREAVEEAGDGEGLVLADPMCGSGTLLIEAALIARDIAPGFMRSLVLDPEQQPPQPSQPQQRPSASGGGGRRNAALAADAWPFQRWADYDAAAWGQAVEEARERVRPPWRGRLLGVDVHEGALSLAVRQARKAGVYNMLELSQGDCGSVTPAAVPNMVVCNPPWGARLDGEHDSFGDEAVDMYGSTARDDGSEYGGDGDAGDGDAGAHLGVVPRDVASAAAAAAGRRNGARRVVGGGGGGSETTPEQEAFLASAWRSLDGFLYRQCPGASATVVSGNSAAFRYLKLKPQSKHRLVLSGVDVQVASYKIRDAASRSSPPPAAASAAPTAVASSAAHAEVLADPSSGGGDAAVVSRGADDKDPIAAAQPAAAAGAASTPPPPSTSSPSSQTTKPATAMAGPLRSADPDEAARSSSGGGAAAAQAAFAARRRAGPPPPPPPPTPQGDYLDADDGYWVSG